MLYLHMESEMAMKVICSWCRGEGQDGFVGEKAPFDDPRETHSICLTHETAVRARWEARRQTTGGLSLPARLIRSPACCMS
ncbi:hypothetical protein COMA1_10422 [Candidatus Nitrospira nitrosa]|uniref:Uncharacterized protein n=1 Tax=Candidatus Nitrospira nitrosa TaxID=1742972 RepID=A0A0S4L5X6_9BACT|nr:hypothetical protein COMA1_10422 [Candidatus Nitrospira nitrosa]